jgi:hypothetical protein
VRDSGESERRQRDSVPKRVRGGAYASPLLLLISLLKPKPII